MTPQFRQNIKIKVHPFHMLNQETAIATTQGKKEKKIGKRMQKHSHTVIPETS